MYVCLFWRLGEFLLRLRQLEKSLLSSLNEAKGRILDDDSIITHLETLKCEAEEIAKRVEETDATMAEVESTSQQYIPLAQSCSSIYFTLESLNQVGTSVYLYGTVLKQYLLHCWVSQPGWYISTSLWHGPEAVSTVQFLLSQVLEAKVKYAREILLIL